MKTRPMTHASLCTGIGACELAATWMGENLFSCEIDEFCNKVLKYHYPKAIHYGNIFEQDFREWRGRVDVLTAGFPCQVYSLAGKRLGDKDDRYLWPQVLRVIEEIRPTWFVGENVAGILSMVLSGEEVKVGSYTDVCGESYTMHETRQVYAVEQIKRDLASIGYSLQPVVIPACAVGAPHRRDRVWFIATDRSNARIEDLQQEREDGVFPSRIAPNTNGAGLPETGAQQRAAGVAGDGLQRDVTNSNGYRFGIRENEQKQITECQKEANDRSCRKDGITSHSQRIRSDKVHENLQPEQPDGPIVDGISGERDDKRYIKIPDWQNFPTQSPVRAKYDGISNIVPRYINQEVYDAIKEYIRREDLPSVWKAFQKKEIREKIGRLYEIPEPGILLEILQRTSKDERPESEQEMLSFFSKETSGRILRYLRKHGTFTSSPLGQKYQKQFSREFRDTMCDLSHEIALATKKIIKECEITYSRWRQESIKALGNSMVPQVVLEIFKAIESVESSVR